VCSGDRRRRQIDRAIDLAAKFLGAAANRDEQPKAIASARSTLVKAHAARAEDARHGAGQLSLGAQRAPTRDACDDGWRRVEEIVAVAEESAVEAARISSELQTPAARKAARVAETAAREARRIVDERNHAYTFHADPAFSFGEGWYLAAAAVLDGVAIQIEPGKAQTSQVERFLGDAGLSARVQPYRSRPRANKQLTEIVACAFAADPPSAQRKVRAAFLGDAPTAKAIVDWIDSRLAGASTREKILLWVRYGAHHPARNTIHAELFALTELATATGLEPILVGDAVRDGEVPAGAVDLTLFWKDPLFQGADMRRAQLQLFEHLKRAHFVIGQIGVTTAGMDGPALLGLPTLYLTDAPNVRMREWEGAVPGYREIVRGEGWQGRVAGELEGWLASCRST
jgi:hypothetical protein